jgi:deazaflavin-dependent oxidoreductase (nitroreductase family)
MTDRDQGGASMSEKEPDTIVDPAEGWVAKHVQRYVESDGLDGHLFHGMPTLLLTTRGRRSGTLRRTALIYGRDGDRFLVVASNGGAAEPPAWYLNLDADPEVGVQVLADRFPARAVAASAKEKPRLWQVMAEIFPTYDRYQANTGREIPVVVIERTE